MPRTCTICNHEKRAEIDQALIGGESLRNIASRYGTTSGSLKRHKDSHLSQALKESKHAEIILSTDNILEQMQDLHNKMMRQFDKAIKRGDDRISISAAREVRENIKLLSELTGLLKDKPEVNVQVNIQEVRAEIKARYDAEFKVIMEVFDELSPEVRAKISRRVKERCPELLGE